MQFSSQQVDEVEQIAKQIGDDSGPKVISQKEEKDHSVLVNVLAALGISVVGTAAVIVLLAVPVSTTKHTPSQVVTTTTMQIASQPNVVVKTEYINPFDSTSQYQNPFVASQNPFANLTQ